jgi:hypothetical protein
MKRFSWHREEVDASRGKPRETDMLSVYSVFKYEEGALPTSSSRCYSVTPSTEPLGHILGCVFSTHTIAYPRTGSPFAAVKANGS